MSAIDVSGLSLNDCQTLRSSLRWQASFDLARADSYGQLAVYLADHGLTSVDQMSRAEVERVVGSLPIRPAQVFRCCVTDALRAEIANGEGLYVGGYHGDRSTAMKANSTLWCAERRHPEHTITQPDSAT